MSYRLLQASVKTKQKRGFELSFRFAEIFNLLKIKGKYERKFLNNRSKNESILSSDKQRSSFVITKAFGKFCKIHVWKRTFLKICQYFHNMYLYFICLNLEYIFSFRPCSQTINQLLTRYVPTYVLATDNLCISTFE